MWLVLVLVLQSVLPSGCPEGGWALGMLEEGADSVQVLAHADWSHWSRYDLVLSGVPWQGDTVVVKYGVDVRPSPGYVVLRVYVWGGYWRLLREVRLKLDPLRCEFSAEVGVGKKVVFSCLSQLVREDVRISEDLRGSWRSG